MMKKIVVNSIAGDAFKIDNFEFRPRISKKVREYLVQLIIDNILLPKKLIVTDKNEYSITFNIDPKSSPKNPDRILWDIKTISGVKDISISSYYDSVSKDMTPEQYTHMIFDGLENFLTKKYKKITPEEVETVREQIDWAFINSLPFPAPFKEQDYILDANPNVEMAYRRQFGE